MLADFPPIGSDNPMADNAYEALVFFAMYRAADGKLTPDMTRAVVGDLFELPEKAAFLSDCPQSWVKNVQVVDLWAKAAGYNLHDMNLFQCPDGRMQVSLLENRTLIIPAPDALGRVTLKNGQEMSMQEAVDLLYEILNAKFPEQSYLWDLTQVKRWGKAPATDKQKAIIAREIDKDPELLVAVQPTRGLDVGALENIHSQLVAERDKGCAILLVSLELSEVMNVSDRILVMYEGEIVGELDPKKTTTEELGLYMAGAKRDPQFQKGRG
jgi:hypothetical protein